MRAPWLALLALPACISRSIPLPPKTRITAVAEILHGVRIVDPYRWLENGDDPEVRRWVGAQNAHTRRILDRRPGRGVLRARIEALSRIGYVGAPEVRPGPAGKRYFHVRRGGTQDQAVLYVRDGLDGRDRVVVDPHGLSRDRTAAIDWWYPSEDGRLVAYGISRRGDEMSTLRVRDVETGRDLPDVIERTRACSVAWLRDSSGFYYTRYPARGSVPPGEERYHRHVYLHRLGTDPARDPKVFGEGREMRDWPNVDLSPNGRWLVVTVHQGWSKTEVYVRDLARSRSGWVPVAEKIDAVFDPLPLDDRILVRTNRGAPRYRVYSVDPRDPRRETEVVREGADVLTAIAVVGKTLLGHYLRDASSRLRRFALSGRPLGEIALPTLGSVGAVTGRWDGDEAFWSFSSFAVPSRVYRLDLATGRTARWAAVRPPIRAADLVVRQVRVRSKDGTAVPMFLVHRKGLARDGSNPVLLTGYGGFNISRTPAFLDATLLFVERGGVYALANLRGGGEFGEAWHRAGMLDKKQNVFDDFIAAAEWLVRERYTRPGRLAAVGGSNGGLLVGAALTQRPDLFRAVVCQVPLLDMIRYHRFRIARLWIPEYGSAEDAEQFRWLWNYSPYHRVRDGVRYPAVLLTTAESDSRVDPMHALKMAARLQAATASGRERPVLLRVETRAGHGAGKPVSKSVEEATDVWTFLLWQLGMEEGTSAR